MVYYLYALHKSKVRSGARLRPLNRIQTQIRFNRVAAAADRLSAACCGFLVLATIRLAFCALADRWKARGQCEYAILARR